MFKTKTVFIVGAGGSKELGLPLGDELKVKIARKVVFKTDHFTGQPTSGDQNLRNALVQNCKNNQYEMPEYINCGANMALALPQALSIDNYLHTHSSN